MGTIFTDDILVDDLNFSVRTTNGLKKNGTYYLSELVQLSYDELINFHGMGVKSVAEVISFQRKIKNNPDFNIDSLLLCKKEITPKITGSRTMLQEALNNLEANADTILYIDYYGNPRDNFDIDEVMFSVRTYNALTNNGYQSIKDVANADSEEIKSIRGFGKKSYDEMLNYFKNKTNSNTSALKFNVLKSECFDAIKKDIKQYDCDFELNYFVDAFSKGIDESIAILEIDEKKLNDETINELLEFVFVSDAVIEALSNYILSKYFYDKDEVYLSTVKNEIPTIFNRYGTFDYTIDKMYKDNKIEKYGRCAREVLPTLDEWMCTLKDKAKKILELRFEGKKLEEVGKIYGITRERVRQICAKTINNKPKTKEDYYGYWFTKYDLSLEALISIFDVDEKVYYYLINKYSKGNIAVEYMLEDEKVNKDIYPNLHKYVYRNSIFIKDEYVLCKRHLIINKLLECYCSQEDIHFSDFYDIYNNFIKEHGLDMDDHFKFVNERSFDARIADNNNVLNKQGKIIRYYPIEEYDIPELVSTLNLKDFKDVEISTLKLFHKYPELMAEYDIRDEYELHNLLRKTEAKWNHGEYDIKFGKMPMIGFGNYNREKQVKDLLLQLVPISIQDFMQMYELEYGLVATTGIGILHQYITVYYNNGVYMADQPLMSVEEKEYMQNTLKDDFYFIEDIKKIFIDAFPSESDDKINSRTLREMGFKVYSHNVLKNTYETMEEYYKKLLTKNPTVDINEEFDPRLKLFQQLYSVLNELVMNYDLLEYEYKKYIRFDHFSSVIDNVTKNDFLKFCHKALFYASDDDYFTIHSLRKKGLKDELFEIGFTEWFPMAILKNSNLIRSFKVGNNYVFFKGKEQKNQMSFLRYLMKKIRKIDVFNLIDYLKEEYGLSFNKTTVIERAKRAGLYYDAIMEKVYYTKEEYYDDI